MDTESYSYEQSLREERDFWRDVAHIIKEDVACLSCHAGEGHSGPDGERYECPLDLVPDMRKECSECPDLGMYQPCCLSTEAEAVKTDTTAVEDRELVETEMDLAQLSVDRASALYELTQTGWGYSSTIMFGNKTTPKNRDKTS